MGRVNTISVINRQRKYEIDADQFETAVGEVLEKEGIDGQELNVVLVSRREMSRLNRVYKGVKGSTDVLSFATRDGRYGDVSGQLLGDMVVCLEQIEAQSTRTWSDARPTTGTRQRELALMAIHGLLHLLGYDHYTKRAEKKMIERERELFDMHWSSFPNFRHKGESPSSP